MVLFYFSSAGYSQPSWKIPRLNNSKLQEPRVCAAEDHPALPQACWNRCDRGEAGTRWHFLLGCAEHEVGMGLHSQITVSTFLAQGRRSRETPGAARMAEPWQGTGWAFLTKTSLKTCSDFPYLSKILLFQPLKSSLSPWLQGRLCTPHFSSPSFSSL